MVSPVTRERRATLRSPARREVGITDFLGAADVSNSAGPVAEQGTGLADSLRSVSRQLPPVGLVRRVVVTRNRRVRHPIGAGAGVAVVPARARIRGVAPDRRVAIRVPAEVVVTEVRIRIPVNDERVTVRILIGPLLASKPV